MNLGIIGYGNIGELISKNIINHDFYNLNKLYIANRTLSKINHLKDTDPPYQLQMIIQKLQETAKK
mgnify:FL=1